MKIEVKKDFQPITITIESKKELAELYLSLNNGTHFTGHVARRITDYLFGKSIMSQSSAEKLLEEAE